MSDEKLYPWQVDGARWLSRCARAGLFDDPGLGKTITAIEAANRVRNRVSFDTTLRVLVVCPSAVTFNWRREWWRWSHDDDTVAVVEHLDQRIDPQANVVIVTHGMLNDDRVFQQLLVPWDLVILDESHWFRSPKAERTKRFFGQHRGPHESIVMHADRVWLLTGTPAPNDVRDLWPMARFLWTNRFHTEDGKPMSRSAFTRTFAVTQPTRWGSRVVANRNVERMRTALADVTLRRRKRDHLPLVPPRHELIVLRPRRLPQDVIQPTRAVLVKLEAAETPEEAYRVAGSKLPISTWRHAVGLLKVDPVLDLIAQELDNRAWDKLVIGAHHRGVIAALGAGIERLDQQHVTITGDTPAWERPRLVDQFQSDPDVRFAICQIQAGGVGVTLTAANEVLLVEQSWTPGDNAQLIDRVHRIGQTNTCRARYVALACTLDEAIAAVLRRKTQLIAEVVD